MNIDQLLDVAVLRKSPDIHLVVGYPPMLRVSGDLIPVMGHPDVSDDDMVAFVSAYLSPEQKQQFEKELEFDLAFSFRDKARFRVNLYHQKGHISADFRFIPIEIPELSTLGLPPAVEKLVDLKQGFILVTGPTGHGKSTTIASMINRINKTRAVNIITIEDPIEYLYPKASSLVSQREMLLDARSWLSALRSALREDPDVLLVGEMRDYETISAAMTIAETGHLVFATLHTNSASQSIDRIIDVFPSSQQAQIRLQLAATLQAVISQRLVPTIAPGRALAVELLLGTPALSSMIRDAKSFMIDNLIQTSGELGMLSMERSLAKLVKDGLVSFVEAQNYTLKPDSFSKLIGK